MIEELIRQNKRKSLLLLILTMFIVMLVGYILGDVLYTFVIPKRSADYQQERLLFSLGFAIFIGLCELIQIYFIFNGKPRTLFKELGLKPANQTQFRKLHNVIAEMSIAAGLPQAPEAYVIPSKALNAMAWGTNPRHSAICVTAGLLAVCNRDELQGVVAHELSHIINKDSLLLEVCRSALGMVIVMRDVLLRSIYWGSMGKSNYRSSSSKGKSSNMHLIFILLGIIFAIIAPLLIRLIYFALSREREYLADAVAARLTRYPPGLASALTKIAYSTHNLDDVDKVTAAAFIDQPYGDAVITSKGSRTHPPIWNRIRILKRMSGGAGYIDYQKAYREVTLNTPVFMPGSMSASTTSLPFREAEALVDEPGEISSADELRELQSQQRSEDVIRLSEGFGFVHCPCGMQIKIPPDYKKFEVKCPRCGRHHILEDKMQNTLAAMLEETSAAGAPAHIISQMMTEEEKEPDYSEEKNQVYKRKERGWQKIDCRCGNVVELSPTFVGKFITCRKCKRKIYIS